MSINKQAFLFLGVTEEDYINWCKENNRPAYKNSSKREFFKQVEKNKSIGKDE